MPWMVTIRCPDCKGTGICKRPGAKEEHSCCGDCPRIEAPRPLGDGGRLMGTGRIRVTVWEAIGLTDRRLIRAGKIFALLWVLVVSAGLWRGLHGSWR